MNIEYIESFVMIHRCGSIQAAAKQLYISQPTLSARLKALEKDLGTTLLTRNKNGVLLTEDGKIFLPYALKCIQTYKEAKSKVGEKPQHININCITSIAAEFLPLALVQLKSEYPKIIPNVDMVYSSEMELNLLSGDCDIAVRHAINTTSFMHIPIYNDPIYYVTSSDSYLAKAHDIFKLDDLLKEPLIYLDENIEYWKKITNYANIRHIPMNLSMHSNRSQIIKALVIKNIGNAFLPKSLVYQDIMKGTLVNIPYQPNLNLYRIIECVYKDSRNSEFVHALVHLLQVLLNEQLHE